jgi:alpha-tubulin suppressor-like RCC1 family protein
MPSAPPVRRLVSIALAAWVVGCTDPTGSRTPLTGTGIATSRSASTVSVTSTTPSAGPTDTTLDVAVNGSGFDNGSIASFQMSGVVDPRVRVNSTRYVKSTQVIANLTIAADAVTGLYDVVVATRGGGKGIGTELFAIKGRSFSLSPTSATFSSTQGGNPDPQTVSVSNSGIGKVSDLAVGTITYGSGQPTGWLSANLNATSAPTTLTLTATSGSLPTEPGTYTAVVPVTSSVANNSPQTVSVTFSANQPAFSAADMSVGAEESCGRTPANEWYCWGRNQNGGVGDGTTTQRLVPTLVTAGSTFATLSAGGFNFVCGLTPLAAAYCWGNNAYGQLGDGTTVDRYTPVPVGGGISFATVTSGLNHACGLTTDGLAYCWGRNSRGQLGDGTISGRLIPVGVLGGLHFTSLKAFGWFTCGITGGGAAYCWGANDTGQLGDGTQINRTSPVAVRGGLTFAALTSSADGEHTCGVTASDGAAYCWGKNSSGELGDGTTTQRLTPVAVAGGLRFAEVSSGSFFTCGLTDTGVAYCWGGNSGGVLGDGTTTQRLTPTRVAGVLTFSSLSTGSDHTCGLSAGMMYCWGFNQVGSLGDGTTMNRSFPTPVRAP